MSGNSSTSLLDSFSALISHCFVSRVSNMVFTVFTVTSFLLILPLAVGVLRLGRQQWWRKCSALISHSDFITFHLVVMEMMHVLASGVYCIGNYLSHELVMLAASHVFYMSACAQMSCHSLTCVERYLAAVHPVTFTHLRRGRGVRIRNVAVLCVWLLGLAQVVVLGPLGLVAAILAHSVHQVFSLALTCFCSLAVLRVLKQSRPEEEERGRVDQSKRRAFMTIMAITGTLLLSFAGFMFSIPIFTSPDMRDDDKCVVLESSYWLRVPSSVVLPLLFLHRKGKLRCGRNHADPHQH